MIKMETAVDIYLDINLLLVVVAIFWSLLTLAFGRGGLRSAFSSQLYLIKALMLITILVPVLHRIFSYVSLQLNAVPGNLSDVMVSYFVRGNLDMKAGALEQLVFMRQNVTSAITAPESSIGLVLLYGAQLYAVYLAVRAILAVDKVRRVLRGTYFWRRFGRIEFRVSDTIHVPFSTRTLRKQVIVVPSYMLVSPDDLKVAIAHEMQHLRQRDIEWEIISTLLMPLFFWNPAFHILKGHLGRLRELACDQQVLRRTGLSPRAYCDSLLRVCANRFERPPLFEITTPNVALLEHRKLRLKQDPAIQLWNRIEAAMDLSAARQPRWKILALSTLVLIACASVTFTVGRPVDWNQDRLMLSTIVNLERMELRNTFAERPF